MPDDVETAPNDGEREAKAGIAGRELASRPSIAEKVRLRVWAAAAGRCTFCNRLVIENDDLGEAVSIGELAHIVGWSSESPRGESPLDRDERRAAENLLLTCRNCHKPVDDAGVVGRYTIDELVRRKAEHELRVRELTAIGSERAAYIVRVVGYVRGVAPELSRETVLAAATAGGLYPWRLPTAHWEDVDLDLRPFGDLSTKAKFESCVPAISDLVARVHDGVRRDDIQRVAIFAFARIPILVVLGAQLDDKLQTLIFQRQRADDVNAWLWPEHPGEAATFRTTLARVGADRGRIALLICLSGTIRLEELPREIDDSHSVYVLAPIAPSRPGPTLVAQPATLANFEATLREFLAAVEADHGKVATIALFPAIPISAAITIGRVLMPSVSPAWRVFDRDGSNRFFEALEVRR